MYAHRFLRSTTGRFDGGILNRSSRIVSNCHGIFNSSSQVRGLASGRVVIVGDDDAFKKFSEKDGKKIFYFTATWCPPCKAIAPIFEGLSADYPDISFLKVDIDDNQKAAGDSGIKSIPTFHFANGQSKVGEYTGIDEKMIKDNIRKLQNA